MSDLHSYIPKRPKKLFNIKEICEKLCKEAKAFFCVFFHTITLHDNAILSSEKPLEFKEEITKEQVDQCKYFFESSIRRREKLELKAEKLLSLLLIFTPLFSALITYIFSKDIPYGLLTIMFHCALGLSVFSVLIAFIAIFRSRKVSDIEEPFISTIIDHGNDKLHEYSQKREGLGFLYCAINNQVRNDYVADFVRAAEYFILLNFIFLMISVVIFSIIISNSNKKPPISLNEIIHTEIKNVTNSIENVASSVNQMSYKIKEINDYFTDQLKTQSNLFEMILKISEKQNEIINDQIALFNLLMENPKEETSRTQQKH
ncbi:hypothetical protein [uncultured Desulfosarcina sp.]|uniref:hypothetical protein n=1 Tax=uncultured Desulfosarcina sp. TaxID=218289 RepID=UPI0029C9A570|nr:hypothetical protein [uncultured Desulfosarcina sp.]